MTRCGHVYCEKCLLEISQRNRRWHCPECRKLHDCAINTLARNYRFEKLVEKFKGELAKPKSETINPFELCDIHDFPKSIRKYQNMFNYTAIT